MNQRVNDYILGSALAQNVFALMRVYLFFAVPLTVASFCAITFHEVIPTEIAESYAGRSFIFSIMPVWFRTWFASSFNHYSLRYMIPPLLAELCVLFASAYYVKDIYALPNYSSAFQYVVASMFGIRLPNVVVDNGKIRKVGRANDPILIEKVGGPAYVRVEPGEAVVFHHLREPSQSVVGGATHFLAPFETIYQIVDLDEQQCDKDEIKAVTRDGIQVVLRDVHFRYSIQHRKGANGRPLPRTTADPYPFEPAALPKMTHNLSVDKKGLEKWNTAVERAVVGRITDFIASHSIDYLTAPRGGSASPHREIRADLFRAGVKGALENVGAELIWVDAGHLEIVMNAVDDQRTNLWASSWMGDSAVTRAYGDALRRAYSDLGRAQAQAEIIVSITEALNGVDLSPRAASNVRRILLARTAQVLESLSDHNPGQEKPAKPA